MRRLIPQILAAFVVSALVAACGGGASTKKKPVETPPGPPAKTIAVLDKNPTPAGIPVGVTCQVVDAAGTAVQALTVVDPVADLEVAGFQVGSKKVGTYPITCSMPEVQGQYEKVAAPLEVKPGDPATIEVWATPDYKNYAIDTVITIAWKVLDAFGNEVPGLPATTTVDPDKGLFFEDGHYTFIVEGKYTVTVTLDAPHQAVSGSIELLCDQKGPEITVLFPARGETFAGDGKVTVKGSVKDLYSDVKKLKLNGADVTLDKDGAFEHPVQSLHGINVIVLTATDDRGNESKTTRGWYYSTAYIPVAEDTKIGSVAIGEGAMLYLGQTALDDGVHDPAHLDDIATLVETVLSGLDLGQMLGDIPIPPIELPDLINLGIPIQGIQAGIKGGVTIGIKVKDVVIGSPTLGLKCRDGGIAATVGLAPASFGLELTIGINVGLYGVNPADGQMYEFPLLAPSATTTSSLGIAKIAVTVDIDIDKKPGQELTVAGKDFQLTLEGIQIDPIQDLVFDLGELDLFGYKIKLGSYSLSQFVGPINDFLANNVLNPVLNFVTQPLIDLLEPLVTGLIGDALKQVLGMLTINQTFEIPSILGSEPVPVDLSLALGSVVFKADGGRIGLNAGVLTKKGVERQPLGSILRAGCALADPEPVLFEFTPQPELQAGVRNDLINEVLFMVWWSGMLHREFDLSSLLSGGQIPIENLRLTLNLLLPPILDDCVERKQRIELADAWIEAKFTLLADQHLGIWLNMKATGGITAAGSKIGIKIEKVDTFEAEITDIAGNLGPMAGMVDSLVPMLLGQIEGQEFSFDVPAIDLGGLVPGLPAGTALTIGNLAATTQVGVTVIGGDLL